MAQNLQSQLQTAEQELRLLLTKIDTGGSTDNLTIGPGTEELTHFNRDYQAQKVALTAIDPEEFKSTIRANVVTKLNNILALEDQLRVAPNEDASTINFDRADARYNHKSGTADLITYRFGVFMANKVEKGLTPEESNSIAAEMWIPLQTLKNKSVGELTRIVLRTIPIDEQLDSDITDLFAGLLQGAETDPDILPTVEQSGLDRSYTGLAELATSQGFRDAIGPALASLLHSLIEKEAIVAYEEPFRTAYAAALQFVTAQALATPKTAEQRLADQSTTEPIPTQLTPENLTPSPAAPLVTPSLIPQAPTTTISINTAPTPSTTTTAPTVDFRHPTASHATQPPAPEEPKIKPLNLP